MKKARLTPKAYFHLLLTAAFIVGVLASVAVWACVTYFITRQNTIADVLTLEENITQQQTRVESSFSSISNELLYHADAAHQSLVHRVNNSISTDAVDAALQNLQLAAASNNIQDLFDAAQQYYLEQLNIRNTPQVWTTIDPEDFSFESFTGNFKAIAGLLEHIDPSTSELTLYQQAAADYNSLLASGDIGRKIAERRGLEPYILLLSSDVADSHIYFSP